MILAMSCATPALQLKTWNSLQTKTAAAATGYTLRDGMVPSSAPQATIQLVPHGDVNPETVVFYRDTNAWCPFCERVYLYLLEADIGHEQTFVDISPGKKPDWYTKVIPTGQTPSLALGGKPVWESNDIIEALESALDSGSQNGTSLLPSGAEDRERVLAELRTLDNPEKGLKIGAPPPCRLHHLHLHLHLYLLHLLLHLHLHLHLQAPRATSTCAAVASARTWTPPAPTCRR